MLKFCGNEEFVYLLYNFFRYLRLTFFTVFFFKIMILKNHTSCISLKFIDYFVCNISTPRKKKSTTQALTKTSTTRVARRRKVQLANSQRADEGKHKSRRPDEEQHKLRSLDEEKHNSIALLLDLFKCNNE